MAWQCLFKQRNVLLPIGLLVSALGSGGCTAPLVQEVAGGQAVAATPREATLTVSVVPETTPAFYDLQSLLVVDWDRVRFTLTNSDPTIAPTVEFGYNYNPGAGLRYTQLNLYSGLRPAAGYTLMVELLRTTVLGQLVTIATGTRSSLVLFPGYNQVTLTTLQITQAAAARVDVIIDTPAFVRDVEPVAGSALAGFADGVGAAARFSSPRGLARDGVTGTFYVADAENHRIRRVDAAGSGTTTYAGTGSPGFDNGAPASATFRAPRGVAVDTTGILYIADTQNHCIRSISPGGNVTTLAGAGTAGFLNAAGASAQFDSPSGVAVIGPGILYVADTGNHRIRKIDVAGAVTTVAGSGTPGFADGVTTAATFNAPTALDVDDTGNVYVADTGNHRIRKIDATGNVTTLAGSGVIGRLNGIGTAASFNAPSGLANDGFYLYVADTENHCVRGIVIGGAPYGQVSYVAGTGTAGYLDSGAPTAEFNGPWGLAIVTGRLFVADSLNQRIRKISH